MAQRYYIYKIIDKATGDVILKDARPQEVSDKIGINKRNISSYALKGWAYKRRYIIKCKAIKRPEKKKFTPQEKIWMAEWDKVRFLLNPKARR